MEHYRSAGDRDSDRACRDEKDEMVAMKLLALAALLLTGCAWRSR
jgi:hypothetical protein